MSNRKRRGLHSSPGIYGKVTDVSDSKKLNVNRLAKNLEGGGTSGGGGHTPVPPEPIDYTKEYLTFTAIDNDCNLCFICLLLGSISSSVTPTRTVEYSLDKKTWYETESIIATDMENFESFITLRKGESIYIRGLNKTYSDMETFHVNGFLGATSDSNYNKPLYNVSGNIMSLIYGDDFIDKDELTEENNACFVGLFNPLFYASMVLQQRYGTLNDCENLILPATALTPYCYAYMFMGCTSIVNAPVLPATTLAEACYVYMFGFCENLEYIKCLATDLSAESCTSYWVHSVADSGNFVKEDGMSGWTIDSENGIPIGWTVYDKSEDPGPYVPPAPPVPPVGAKNYLCITALKNGCSVYFNYIDYNSEDSGETEDFRKTIYYSSDQKHWYETTARDAQWVFTEQEIYYVFGEPFITLNKGEFVYLKGENIAYCNSFEDEHGHLQVNWLCCLPSANNNITPKITGEQIYPWTVVPSKPLYDVSGNLMSLVYGDNFERQTELSGMYNFAFFFCQGYPYNKNMYIHSCSGLTLGATKLSPACYINMFQTCSGLIDTPILPATTLSELSYGGMFIGCTHLKKATELPIRNLTLSCYQSMFSYCVSLTEAPTLPATTLADDCYNAMFYKCTSLRTAPELPATTLSESCYSNMFGECSSLNYIKCLATDISAENCTYNWVSGVSYSGTFVKNPDMNNWTTGVNGIPVHWEVEPKPILTPSITFTANQANSTVGLSKLSTYQQLDYSQNNGTSWTTMTTATTITLPNSGDTVLVRGILNGNNDYNEGNYTNFTINGNVKVSGNINSLWNYNNLTMGLKDDCGAGLFTNCVGLTDVSELELPSTTLANGCYWGMFENCTLLTTAPELPATALANECYSFMFKGCASLTTAPLLPATVLSPQCYFSMFEGCTSLTVAPILSATYIPFQAYYCMFSGCSSLINIQTTLPATTLSHSCYSGMFANCVSLTTAPTLPATTLDVSCYESMFSGCTSLVNTPELSATTLVAGCYKSMFSGCTSLTTTTALPATTLASYCYRSMFEGCARLVNTPALPATTLAPQCYFRMFKNCTSLMQAPVLSATTLASQCYTSMFAGCTSLTTPPSILPATTLDDYCYEFMFDGCTGLTAAPSLPATTLANYCYNSMFVNCTSLTTAPVLPATTLAKYCYSQMFTGCRLTTAPELPATSLAEGCYARMFSYCTSLTQAPVLSSTTLANYCYGNMFAMCTSLTQAPVLPATTLASQCYSSMFQGCSGLTTAPELPATILVNGCYQSMFDDCKSLAYIKCLATDISAEYCTTAWVSGVNATGTFVKNDSMTNWTTGSNGIPNGWTVQDNT